jgi:hypothetical protein
MEEYDAALSALENKPIVTIYTEDDHNEPYGSAKAFPDEQTVTLVAEIMIAQVGQIQVEGPNGTPQPIGALEAGATDREREGILDLIDSQVRRVLDTRNNLAPLMLPVAMELRSIHDDPQRDAHRSVRLALRTVKFHFKIKKELWPAMGSTPPSGIAGLPCPLRNVAEQLPAGSSALAMCTLIASSLAAPPPLPSPLESIRIWAPINRGADASNAETVASGTDIPEDVQASAIGSPN